MIAPPFSGGITRNSVHQFHERNLNRLFKLILAGCSRALFFDLTGGHIPEFALELLSAMEKRRSRYQTLRWQLARERIGQLVRENYRADQEMSPRLAALVKKLENGSPELSTEMFQVPGGKQEN
jgi:hypothetical protein